MQLRAVRGLIIAALLVLAGLATAPVTRAACDGPAPPFDEGIRNADLIVIGEVLDVRPPADPAMGGATTTLRVDRVVKGTPPATELTFGDVFLHPCAGYITSARGDVIAVAFGASEQFGADVNPVAYIRGEPWRSDLPRMSAADVYALANVPIPPAEAIEPAFSIPGAVLVALIGVVVIGGVWRLVTER